MDLSNYKPRPAPGDVLLTRPGADLRLEPFDWAQHGKGLTACLAGAKNAPLWTYMPSGPFSGDTDLKTAFDRWATIAGWKIMVIISAENDKVLGMASYMRIRRNHGSAEVGCITFGSTLQRTTHATLAMYLMAKHIFEDLGYRRYEWKCNSENEASKRAATRLGFQYEGLFRNDMVVKNCNRDTAWYSIIDTEWPIIKAGFKTWLSPDNFDQTGHQIRTLENCRKSRKI